MDEEEHAVKGSEVFVGGLARTVTESSVREVSCEYFLGFIIHIK